MRRKSDICRRCQNPKPLDMCEYCKTCKPIAARDSINASRKRNASGEPKVCQLCPNPAEKRHRYCPECAKKRNAETKRASYAEAKERNKDNPKQPRRKHYLCARCKKNYPDYRMKYCNTCKPIVEEEEKERRRVTNRERERARAAAKRAAPKPEKPVVAAPKPVEKQAQPPAPKPVAPRLVAKKQCVCECGCKRLVKSGETTCRQCCDGNCQKVGLSPEIMARIESIGLINDAFKIGGTDAAIKACSGTFPHILAALKSGKYALHVGRAKQYRVESQTPGE